MLPLYQKTRRPLAFHLYAVLCGMAGVSGLALSLWVHPLEQSARTQMVATAPPVHTAPASLILPADYAVSSDIIGPL